MFRKAFLRALHRAVAGDHEQIAVLVIIPAVEHGGDPLSRLELEDVVQMGSLGGPAGLGNLISLLLVHPAGTGEEENVVVAGGGEQGVHTVLLPQALGGDPLAAPLLGAVGGHRHPLDVPGGGEGEDAGSSSMRSSMSISSSTSWISVIRSSPYLSRISSSSCFITPTSFPVGQQLLVPGDLLLQLVVFLLSFSRVQALKAISRMSQMAWAWTSVQVEAVHQVLLALS